MRIPEIRDRIDALEAKISDIADALHEVCAEMTVLTGELVRRKAIRRAANKSQPMTPALASAIRAHYIANPSASQKDIAILFNVNPGRVSEAMRGKRT